MVDKKEMITIGVMLGVLCACTPIKQENPILTESTVSSSSTEQTTSSQIPLQHTYAPSGRFAPDVLGYTLPHITTTAELTDLGKYKGEDEISGLFKENKTEFHEKLGTENIPYHIFMLREDVETYEKSKEIIKDHYHDKVMLLPIAEQLYLPILNSWNMSNNPKGKEITVLASELDINITIKGKLGKTKTQDDIITELGRIYAKEYPTLLENKDRQGFYLYTKLKNAGAIV
ncbi:MULTISPECIES: hypothetical protein, partial [unclassified Granulicatella]|uniref:hypothetical protein n=1 Tax=unclassified Granulicatella TaxID=2630493 RepID=UPI0010747D97